MLTIVSVKTASYVEFAEAIPVTKPSNVSLPKHKGTTLLYIC